MISIYVLMGVDTYRYCSDFELPEGYCLVGWLVGWFVGWLVGWLVDIYEISAL